MDNANNYHPLPYWAEKSSKTSAINLQPLHYKQAIYQQSKLPIETNSIVTSILIILLNTFPRSISKASFLLLDISNFYVQETYA